MGNQAFYWYKDSTGIETTELMITDLKNLGLIPENEDDFIDTSNRVHIENGRLVFMFVNETNIWWKTRFEAVCKEHNIPIQKWMEG